MVDNLSDHLIGNVYAKFFDEKAASNAYENLKGKYYHSDLVVEEYCPIINPKDGKCYKYEDGLCNKGPYCNFLHFKEINYSLVKSLKDEMYEIHPEYRKNRFSNINNNNNLMKRKRERRHEHTSSESSLDRYDKFTRKRIIHRWNDEFLANKKLEEKRKLIEKLHKKHKHRKKHRHHKHSKYSEKEEDSDSDHDKLDKYDKLKKKKFKEDLNYYSDKDENKEIKKSKSESIKSEKIDEKIKLKNKSDNDNNSKNKSKSKSKTPSRENKVDSDEEETISAGEFEKEQIK